MAGSNHRYGWTNRMKSFQCKQVEINRIIIKYLVTEGYLDLARRFETQAKLDAVAQQDSVEYQARIHNAVQLSRFQYAIDMAKRLYPKLFETENYMYFHMQQLRLIELIRERKGDASASGSGSTSGSASGSGVSPDTSGLKATLALPGTSLEQPVLGASGGGLEQASSELDPRLFRCEQTASMEPKMMFLVKLILWAQTQLDNDGCGPRCQGLDLETDDLAAELKWAMLDD